MRAAKVQASNSVLSCDADGVNLNLVASAAATGG
jgi:hypothetical protein